MIITKQIPFPSDNTWSESLRFIAQTMAPDDINLEFIVSLWSYSIANNGLTKKQISRINKFTENYIKIMKANLATEILNG